MMCFGMTGLFGMFRPRRQEGTKGFKKPAASNSYMSKKERIQSKRMLAKPFGALRSLIRTRVASESLIPILVSLSLCGLLIILSPFAAHAQQEDAVQAFEEGNQRYSEGAYALALEAYEQALAAGYASGALYYNMGNAHFRQDDIGQAILHYEKARRLMPDNAELLHNLGIVRARTQDTFSQVPTPFWIRGWRLLVAAVPPASLLLPGLLLYLVAIALLGHRIWTRTRNAWHRRLLAVSSGLGIVLLLVAFAASWERTRHAEAVLLDAQVDLQEAPESESASALTIHEGLVVDVLQRNDHWTEVRLPNGVTGWVRSEALGLI